MADKPEKPIHPGDVVNRARDMRFHDLKVGDTVILDQPGFFKVHRVGVVTHLEPHNGKVLARFPWSTNGESEVFDPLLLMKANNSSFEFEPSVKRDGGYDDWGKQLSEEKFGKVSSKKIAARLPWIQWKKDLLTQLDDWFGIGVKGDPNLAKEISDGHGKRAWNSGDSVEEFLEWYGEKRDLDRLAGPLSQPLKQRSGYGVDEVAARFLESKESSEAL